MTKTFLFPAPDRKGHQTTQYVVKDDFGCWLGTLHGLNPHASGRGTTTYSGDNRVKISPELYQSFVTEAHLNAAKFAEQHFMNKISPVLVP